MDNFEIIVLLKTFSKEEIKKFDEFLRSPYHNKNKKLSECFTLLKKSYPSFSNKSLTKEKLYKKLYNNNKFSDNTMKRLLWDLKNAAVKFITIENMNKNSFNVYDHLMNELNSRKQKNLFIKYSSVIGEEFKKLDEADVISFYNKYKFGINSFNYIYINEKISKEGSLNNLIDTLNNTVLSFAKYFITELISAYLNLLTLSRTYKLKIEDYPMHDLLHSLQIQRIIKITSSDRQFDFLMDIYLCMLEAFLNTDRDSYLKYKNIVSRYSDKLSNDELSFHYLKLINCCIQRIAYSKNAEFNNELFEIYKIMLAKELYKDKKLDHLPHDLYRDILLHALRMKNFKWSAFFIEIFSMKVHPDDRDNMKNFGHMYLQFYLGNFREAIEHINNINLDYFIYKYDIKNLKLRIYYELKDDEGALYLIKSYSEFLRKNALTSSERTKRYMNFVKILHRIILYRSGKRRIDLGFIKVKLQNTNDVTYKSWLIEKIEELAKK